MHYDRYEKCGSIFHVMLLYTISLPHCGLDSHLLLRAYLLVGWRGGGGRGGRGRQLQGVCLVTVCDVAFHSRGDIGRESDM